MARNRYDFEYSYTCPLIDKQIRAILDCLEEDLKDLLNNEDTRLEDVKYYALDMYSRIECYIEEVRTINSNMRDSAQKQIEELGNIIDDLQYDLDQKNRECDSLEYDVNNLIGEIENLKEELNEARVNI